MNVTLDTNGIYALEETQKPGVDTRVRQNAAAIRTLIALHDRGHITLRLAAASASENQQGDLLSNFSQFEERLARLGLGHLEILKPMWHLGMSFLGNMVLGSDEGIALQNRIWAVLFPQSSPDYRVYCAARGIDPNTEPTNRKWRKKSCDVQIVWCHIQYGGDLLVTTDGRDILRRKGELVKIGVGDVLSPVDAVARLERDQGARWGILIPH